MKSESTHYLGLLERRLRLLESLCKTLTDSRKDFTSLNLESIEGCIAEQEQFCLQIRSLDAEITLAQKHCGERMGTPLRTGIIAWPVTGETNSRQDQQIHAILGRVAAAQEELKRLNDAHQAMLRRSRQTVKVLLNLLCSYAPTYATQTTPTTGTVCEERV